MPDLEVAEAETLYTLLLLLVCYKLTVGWGADAYLSSDLLWVGGTGYYEYSTLTSFLSTY